MEEECRLWRRSGRNDRGWLDDFDLGFSGWVSGLFTEGEVRSLGACASDATRWGGHCDAPASGKDAGTVLGGSRRYMHCSRHPWSPNYPSSFGRRGRQQGQVSAAA